MKNMKYILGLLAGFLMISGIAFWFFAWRLSYVDAGGPDPSCEVGFHWIQDLPAYPYHGECVPEMKGEDAAQQAILDSYMSGYNDCKDGLRIN